MSYGFSNGGQNKTWITVNNGKLVVRAQEGEEGAVIRKYTNKKGEEKTVWEFQSKSFTGDIKGSSMESTKWGQFFCVDLSTPDKDYQLRLDLDNRLFGQFAKRIPNIDKSQPLQIDSSVDEKGRNVIFLKQGGKHIKFAFTKDNPNGMPAYEQKVVKGKTEWDSTEQVNFLWEIANNWHTTEAEGVGEYEPDPAPPTSPVLQEEGEDEVPF